VEGCGKQCLNDGLRIKTGRRPADANRTAYAQPFTVFDWVNRYRLPVKVERGRLEAFFTIQNLFDVDWRQAQFFYESQLRGQPAVTDIHFVPGTPGNIMGGVAWYF
jgi:hypothetical protein